MPPPSPFVPSCRLAVLRLLSAVLALAMAPALAAPAGQAAAPPDAPADGPGAAAGPGAPIVIGRWVHALSAYVPPKYPPGFDHFDYVRRRRPEGRHAAAAQPGPPLQLRQVQPLHGARQRAGGPGASSMFETLATSSQDEPQTMYGLLAEEMMVAPDYASVVVPAATRRRASRTATPVTAADVVYSFEQITGPEASPTYRSYFAGHRARGRGRCDAPCASTCARRTLDNVFIVGGVPVFSRQWGAGKPFDEIVARPPDHHRARTRSTRSTCPGASSSSATRTTGRRDARRAARAVQLRPRDLPHTTPTRRSRARPSRPASSTSSRSTARARWVRQHQGAKWDDGRIVRTAFPTGIGQGLQAYPVQPAPAAVPGHPRARGAGADLRLRHSSTDYGLFKRAHSVFNNSEFAATGLPSAGELKLLEPFRAELPPRVFGPAWQPRHRPRRAQRACAATC